MRRWVWIGIIAAFMLGGVLAQQGFRGGFRGGRRFMDYDSLHTPREIPQHSYETPTWTNPPGFESDVFTFVRIQRESDFYTGGGPWWTDTPDANVGIATGKVSGITVVDDYGHHPTEIRATLAAARLCRYPRVHVLFQPHRYTRTQFLMEEFGKSFHQADTVHVLDIYAASEKPIEGVTGEALVEKIRAYGHRGVEYVGTIDRGVEAIVAVAKEGDVVITLGAGSVWQAGDKILERLRGE